MKGWKGQAGSGRHSMGVDNYLLSDGSASPSASCTVLSHALPDGATRIRYRAVSHTHSGDSRETRRSRRREMGQLSAGPCGCVSFDEAKSLSSSCYIHGRARERSRATKALALALGRWRRGAHMLSAHACVH